MYIAIQQFTALPKFSPHAPCFVSDSILTSSTCTHLITEICEFLYCFHFITYLFFLLHCLSNILFTVSESKIFMLLWNHHFHSGTSTIDPLTTLCTQNCVSLYSQAADPTWVNLTFRHDIQCNAATDHHLGFQKVNFQAFALKIPLPFKNLLLNPSIFSLIRSNSSAYNN